MTGEHKRAVMRVLDSGQISPGPVCKEFEAKFALYHGAGHGLFVNSGTDALRIAILALKDAHAWKDGSFVAVPASTFVATANIVIQAGLRPVPVDVRHFDSNMDPISFERVLAYKPKRFVAVIIVHLFGQIAPMDELLEIARLHNLKVIEDSCESMGVAPIQSDVACYSTYVCHILSTGVGGLAITNSKKYANLMRSYANHGRDFSNIPGFKKGKMAARFKFDRIGYSARATEMQAAIGLIELSRLNQAVRKRQENARTITEALKDYPSLILPYFYENAKHAFMMYPIVVREFAPFKRDRLCKYLEKHGIETRPWLSLVGQPCYRGILNTTFMPASRFLRDHGFYIACHDHLSQKEIAYILRTFKKFFTNI